jgi:predicted acetyltransferase
MALGLRWVGEDELDRVAATRMLCYAHAAKDLEKFREGIRSDIRAKPGDFLIAERDGIALGTSTALSMTMWVRGSPIGCQGVAYVGTIKTHRRRAVGEDGVATQLMRETLRNAREQGQVVSALMPFRASYYEHFGYGLVERRNEWTLPLSVLPHGSCESIRVFQPEDLRELVAFRQRTVELGQCDIERSVDAWTAAIKRSESGFFYVDRASASSPVTGYLWIEHEKIGTKDYLRIVQSNYADSEALKRQFYFLSSLKDQYLAVVGAYPADLPLNWLLRETQVPHRHVNHATAEVRPQTRMQLRILDHKRFVEALHLPGDIAGRVNVSVRESEGTDSVFAIDIEAGRAAVKAAQASAVFSCTDRIWAAVACGDLTAEMAVGLGLASASDSRAIEPLRAFSAGSLPFCHEYF